MGSKKRKVLSANAHRKSKFGSHRVKLAAKKDRRVEKSSHGKWKSVRELEDQRRRQVEARGRAGKRV